MAATGIEPALTVAAVRPDASGLDFIMFSNIFNQIYTKLIQFKKFPSFRDAFRHLHFDFFHFLDVFCPDGMNQSGM